MRKYIRDHNVTNKRYTETTSTLAHYLLVHLREHAAEQRHVILTRSRVYYRDPSHRSLHRTKTIAAKEPIKKNLDVRRCRIRIFVKYRQGQTNPPTDTSAPPSINSSTVHHFDPVETKKRLSFRQLTFIAYRPRPIDTYILFIPSNRRFNKDSTDVRSKYAVSNVPTI